MTGYIFKCNYCNHVKVLWDTETDVEKDHDCPVCQEKNCFVREIRHRHMERTINKGSLSYVMGKDRDRVREMKYNDSRSKRYKK